MEFVYESKKVLLGQLAFNQKYLNGSNGSLSVMIRNTHRLEKGLIVSKRKKIFGVDYIFDLVEAYCYQILKCPHNLQIKWTHDVLEEYFKSVQIESHENIQKAYDLFLKTPYFFGKNKTKFLPKPLEKFSLSYDLLLSFFQSRHCVRSYQKKKVLLSTIKKALKLALTSPSGCNRQPFRVIFINNSKMLKSVSPLLMGMETFRDEVRSLMFIIGDFSYFSQVRDRHLIYVDSGMFCMSFMMALESLGLSSCPLHWPSLGERDMVLEGKLKLKPFEQCVLALAIGYAKKGCYVLHSQRKQVDDILRYNDVCID